jgi:hypothetical protein
MPKSLPIAQPNRRRTDLCVSHPVRHPAQGGRPPRSWTCSEAGGDASRRHRRRCPICASSEELALTRSRPRPQLAASLARALPRWPVPSHPASTVRTSRNTPRVASSLSSLLASSLHVAIAPTIACTAALGSLPSLRTHVVALVQFVGDADGVGFRVQLLRIWHEHGVRVPLGHLVDGRRQESAGAGSAVVHGVHDSQRLMVKLARRLVNGGSAWLSFERNNATRNRRCRGNAAPDLRQSSDLPEPSFQLVTTCEGLVREATRNRSPV